MIMVMIFGDDQDYHGDDHDDHDDNGDCHSVGQTKSPNPSTDLLI